MFVRLSILIAAIALIATTAACSATQDQDAPADVEGADVDIVGQVWQWTSTVTPVETIEVDDPTKYTLTLGPDDQATIVADCNSATTSYTLDGGSISFGPMASTMAECGPDSLYDRYLADLSGAAIWFTDGGDLMIDMQMDSGTMRFANGGPADSE